MDVMANNPIVEKLFTEDKDFCPMFNKYVKVVKKLGAGEDGEVLLVKFNDNEEKKYVLKRTKHWRFPFPISQNPSDPNWEGHLFNETNVIPSVVTQYKNHTTTRSGEYRPVQNITPCLREDGSYSCADNVIITGINEDGTIQRTEDGKKYKKLDYRKPRKDQELHLYWSGGPVIVSEYVISKYLASISNSGEFYNFLDIGDFWFCPKLDTKELAPKTVEYLDNSSSFILLEQIDGILYDLIVRFQGDRDILGPVVLQVALSVIKMSDLGISHNDLHMDNIGYLDVTPNTMWGDKNLYNKWYSYKDKNGVEIYFRSPYLVKPIDFGRAQWYHPVTKNLIIENGALEYSMDFINEELAYKQFNKNYDLLGIFRQLSPIIDFSDIPASYSDRTYKQHPTREAFAKKFQDEYGNAISFLEKIKPEYVLQNMHTGEFRDYGENVTFVRPDSEVVNLGTINSMTFNVPQQPPQQNWASSLKFW